MKSKPSSVMPLGQRSIPSTFLFRCTNRSNGSECKKDISIKASNEKVSRISFSEYLNKKLGRSSELPRSVLGKERPFSSAIGCENLSSCSKGESIGKKRGEADKGLSLDIILQQFKGPKTENENVNTSASGELGTGSSGDKFESRKRMRVLGDDDSEPKRRRKAKKTLASKEEPIPLFNHYANGCGWWDCDMEGVDNEEVGCSEVWEGMGSTTLGGLDWH
ncbi:hypothetical protein M9H77_31464 [Catharanthus roseus]|uniref:Uncharacterized protein n=1 Tax=Catharanthus roseus TaxID=4058 RepID=A0ACC0A1F5_CATRO|nr:hypothetical protein M9H77_31464 [Catharanthus roseus]